MQRQQKLGKENTSQTVEGETEGKYIYCIAGANDQRRHGPIGIGNRGDVVETFSHDGLAAIISNSCVKKYPISKINTICHQKVMEEVMKSHTVLPVRFSTIAEDKEGKDGSPMVPSLERIRQRVLIERRQEFIDLIRHMDTKMELGVKVLWTDMKEVFKEIVQEKLRIKNLKEKIERINITNPRQVTHRERVKLGEMVKDALNAKREKLKNIVMGVLSRSSYDTRVNKNFGDNMILNGAFLVEKDKVADFENGLEKLIDTYAGKIKFKYIGPIPPSNFVEVVITWE